MDILYLALGLIAGAGVVYFVLRSKGGPDNTEELQQLRNTNLELQTNGSRLEERNSQLATQLEDKRNEAEKLQQTNTQLSNQLATSESNLQHLQQRLDEQKKDLENLQEKFTVQFKNIANEILEDKSKRFTEQNKTNIGELLNPLKEKIKEFEEKVDSSHKASLTQNASLKEQLNMLQSLNQQMSNEAKALTRALKGDSKVQGGWGEYILMTILENSGLVKDREYFVQETFKSDDGKSYRPDIIVKLPEGRKIIIDSKVSLTDYERYSSADNDDERASHLKGHIRSLRAHIKGLSEKEYQNLPELNGLNFVLLFVPIEPALSIAAQADQQLLNEAWEKNIAIVSSSTLMISLHTIASIWQQENQNKNALEIARQSGALYDKFVGFYGDLIDVGKRLESTQKSYREAMNKIHDGNDNLVRKVERIKELGAKAAKTLPQNALDRAGIESGTQIELPEE